METTDTTKPTLPSTGPHPQAQQPEQSQAPQPQQPQPFQQPQAQPQLEPTFPPPRQFEPKANEQSHPAPPLADPLFALTLLALGFCFWEWQVLEPYAAGIGATLFFLLALASSSIYLRACGIRQNAQSLLMFLVAVLGAAPFALNGARDINLFLLPLEASACLLWVMYTCRTSIANRLSGLLVCDLLNQVFIVPLKNFKRLFTQPFQRRAGSSKILFPVLLAFCGIIVCIPVFGIIVWLLAESDDGFRALTENALALFDFAHLDVARYTLQLIFGIPIAAYIFGAVFGNAAKQHSFRISSEGSLRAFNAAHVLPRALLYAPLTLLILLYIVYFIAMESYLLSGLQGQLPTTYTYAEYARQGFFELCTVATINLCILAGVWLLARRGAEEHPLALRALSGLLALFTCLLIITAASKMLLYIQTYGLTPLRVYTTWFMALMLFSFLALLIWHIRPYNVARPLIILAITFTLGLGLANTNGLVAEHNVSRYLSGQTQLIDVELLAYLGDPALPALHKLRDGSSDPALRTKAKSAIERICELHPPATDWGALRYNWYRENLQSYLAALKYGE